MFDIYKYTNLDLSHTNINAILQVIGNAKGVGGLGSQQFLKESMRKQNWNFQMGGGLKPKKPCVGRVWTSSGTTHSLNIVSQCKVHFVCKS